jgi:lipopolysaccharide/colanic/teichoic acid biosynthesis glycosyltransferase
MDNPSYKSSTPPLPSGGPLELHPLGMAIKRLGDLIIACGILIVCLPIFVVTAILIKLDSAGPVFFRQGRVGLNGRLFRIFKFRTMVVGAANMGTGLVSTADDPRTTRLTRFLRKYRIDELPQLFNVLRGEMSLVGPRPLVPLHAHAWTEQERKRTGMRPGITGWQQVCGGATNTWEERIALEVWYVDHWSLWLDFLIFVRTPWAVLRGTTTYGRDGQEISAIPTRSSPLAGLNVGPSKSQSSE